MRAWMLIGVLALSLETLAAVGTVTAVEGTATRTPRDGVAVPLAVDQQIELGDTLESASDASVQLTLSDESTLMLGSGARLQIDEADFASLDDRRFSARLHAGELWAHVKRALVGSGAKFEVVTERAVAGVRGTIFEVAVARGATELETTVGVEEGEVEVLQLNEGVAADAPREKRFRKHRIKKGEALLVKRKQAQKRKFMKKANAFRRFVERKRIQRGLERTRQRLERREQRRP